MSFGCMKKNITEYVWRNMSMSLGRKWKGEKELE